jgi:hypothetical protein
MLISTLTRADLALENVRAAGVALALVPTDPASVFVYLLIAVAGYFIWRGSRGPAKGAPPRHGDE